MAAAILIPGYSTALLISYTVLCECQAVKLQQLHINIKNIVYRAYRSAIIPYGSTVRVDH